MSNAEDVPIGPIVDDKCDRYGCGKPASLHREGFMDLRTDVIDHDFEEPAPRPYDHERVPAMIRTEWRCHACKAENDVWGTGATEGYMECGSCGAYSWLDFDPDGYENPADRPAKTTPTPEGDAL